MFGTYVVLCDNSASTDKSKGEETEWPIALVRTQDEEKKWLQQPVINVTMAGKEEKDKLEKDVHGVLLDVIQERRCG